jgi:hypothetical protein
MSHCVTGNGQPAPHGRTCSGGTLCSARVVYVLYHTIWWRSMVFLGN